MNLDFIDKTKENVLVACLSKFLNDKERKVKATDYTYVCGNAQEGQKVPFAGYMTNEAPVKAVIEDLAQKGERLDRVVVICSEDVRKSDSAQNDVVAKIFSSFGCEKMSTLDYYQHMVEQYVKSDHLKALYKKPIEFKPVPISNNPEETEITSTIVRVAKYIKADDLILEKDYFVQTDLYFDYLGGQRYIAYMLYAIAALLSFGESVNIQKVLTMNFENRDDDGSVAVNDMKTIFRTGDFAAAVKEVTSYGRVKGLKEYFKNTDKSIINIIHRLDEFLQHLQLCHTGYIMEKRASIKKELEQYNVPVAESEDNENSGKQVYSILFAYVVKDILHEYEPLLSGNLPDILEWCAKHDFMQQALTFCNDLLPDYLIASGLLKPTEKEQAEYKTLFSYFTSNENNGIENDTFKQVFRFMSNDSTEIMKHYNWFTEYLIPNRFVTRQLQEKTACRRELSDACGENIELFFQFAPTGCRSKSEKILWHINENTGRVETNAETEALKKILSRCKELKEQRDVSNHSGTKNVPAWKYETLKKKMTELCRWLNAGSEQKQR